MSWKLGVLPFLLSRRFIRFACDRKVKRDIISSEAKHGGKREDTSAGYSSLAFWLRFQTMPVCSLELNPSFS